MSCDVGVRVGGGVSGADTARFGGVEMGGGVE